MRDIKNKLISGKNTKNIKSRRGKMFGYQVLGFGSGGRKITPFIIATGGTVTTVNTNFKVHTFTGPGTFCVSNEGTPAGSNLVDYLVVAGGGSGHGSYGTGGGGSGGGAGGFRESTGCSYTSSSLGNCVSALPLSKQAYPITVGAGGVGGAGYPNVGTSGADSFYFVISSVQIVSSS